MPETLEAEVIEIDGRPPEVRPSKGNGPGRGRSGMNWGRFIRFDKRWWPLWILVGMVAVAVAIVLGLVGGVLYIAFSVVRASVRLVFGRPSSSLSR